ncbi:T9SS type A sorting domain-containing protein [Flavobacteriaceae sp. LMIT009]
MKKTTSLFLMLSTYFCFSQNTGSGTITFNAVSNVPIEATATSLFDDGAHVYQISGNTNEAIAFSSWQAESTLALPDLIFEEDIYLPKNPSGALNLFIRIDNIKDLVTHVYDLNGRLVSKPTPLSINNGVVHIYDVLTNQSDGLYFVKVNHQGKEQSLKFIKRGEGDGPTSVPSRKKEKKLNYNQSRLVNNYVITWNDNDWIIDGTKDILVLEGASNTIAANITSYDVSESGDAYITAQDQNSLTIQNVSVTMSSNLENYEKNLSTGISGFIIVDNHPVLVNPTPYTFTFSKAGVQTVEIVQDLSQGESNNVVQATMVTNVQDITFYVYNYKTLLPEEGVTLELINNDTDTVVDSQITDNTGMVFFDDVPDNTTYRTKSSKTGHYTKNSGTLDVPLVDTNEELTATYNTTTVEKDNYSTGEPVLAAHLNAYKPYYQTEWILGHRAIYLPPAPGRQDVIDEMNAIDALLGLPNSTTYYDTPFSELTADQLINYDPYLDANTYPGITGTNLEYEGTDTNAKSWTLDNGTIISPYATEFKIGGNSSNLAPLHHENLQQLGHNQNPAGLVPATTLNPNTTTITPYDIFNVNAHATMGKNHFVNFINGKSAEYNLKILIFED